MDVLEEDDIDKELFNMALVVPEQSQRPYRFGMTLLCIGALFNWLGLADSYTEPVPAVRYIGVGLIAVGAALICLAMCCWMRAVQDPQFARELHNRENVAVQVINIEEPDPRSLEKPPDYSSVVDFPPSYEDAIKELDANKLLYACVTNNNNNYEDPIKTIEDTFVIISQLDGKVNDEVDNQISANAEDSKTLNVQEIKQDSLQHKESKETMKSVPDKNKSDNVVNKVVTHMSKQNGHTIVEMPEYTEQKDSTTSNTANHSGKSHSSNQTKDLKESRPCENAGNLVINETRPTNILSNVLRKSFRSLRKSTTLPTLPSSSSGQNSSDNCDNENAGRSNS
uniref:Uncharacterized protein n=2 Tax=Cacopsylla melanoneura TaxID=428564 RepID=A0A8D8X0R4_9HEMI